MKQTKRIFWIISGLAALAIVAVAFLFHRGIFDTGKDAEQPTVSPLDETRQSPRLRSPSAANGAGAETERGSNATDQAGSGDEDGEDVRASGGAAASINDLDAAAREYDDNGQIGEPPEGWKPDYSHWDTTIWIPLEKVGIINRVSGTALVYRPSEETRQRRKEIEDERNAAIEKGLIIGEPREGYVKRGFGEGDDVAYVARSFVGRFDALLLEDIFLNKGGMRETPAVGYTGGGGPISYRTPVTKNFELHYYREKDGSLTRKVILNFKNGKVETFKVSPPPDLEALGFEPRDIEHQKKRWEAHNHLRDK